MVEAVRPLAHKQKRVVELSKLSQSLQVTVEELASRQALSNLIEGALLSTQVGGKVEIVSAAAPTGGALVVIDDDGPDMHYMALELPSAGDESSSPTTCTADSMSSPSFSGANHFFSSPAGVPPFSNSCI
ncbi:hypothetical protein LWI29_003820 [Acer saccharum]|uniref:Uncharacterized protein n=1 Tax=Acer saccharum TaxID=4024 RepID=A0AA39VJP6_ACESA|nr:hypothetical protein LWI29_003820 [Acer saccharum]